MNQETALQLQAWLDGELPPKEGAAIALILEGDAEARALVDELRTTRAAMASGEPQRHLAESREFYWSKIEREILKDQAREPSPGRTISLHWLLRLLVPAAVAGAMAMVFLVPVLTGRPVWPMANRAEIDSPLEDISSFTFRSESERMNVVWIASR